MHIIITIHAGKEAIKFLLCLYYAIKRKLSKSMTHDTPFFEIQHSSKT